MGDATEAEAIDEKKKQRNRKKEERGSFNEEDEKKKKKKRENKKKREKTRETWKTPWMSTGPTAETRIETLEFSAVQHYERIPVDTALRTKKKGKKKKNSTAERGRGSSIQRTAEREREKNKKKKVGISQRTNQHSIFFLSLSILLSRSRGFLFSSLAIL